MTDRGSKSKRGENNPRAKLDLEKVRAIRRYARRKSVKRGWKSEMARKFDVSPATITGVLSGAKWNPKRKAVNHV